MSHPTTAWLAWSLCVVCVALIVLALLLDFVTPSIGLPTGLRPEPSLAILTGILSLAYPTVGALIVSRLPANPIGWLFCIAGLLSAVRPFPVAYADYALLENPALPGEEYLAWFSSWARRRTPADQVVHVCRCALKCLWKRGDTSGGCPNLHNDIPVQHGVHVAIEANFQCHRLCDRDRVTLRSSLHLRRHPQIPSL